MKNIITALAAAIMLLATACGGNEARKQLAAEIEAANRSYPVSLGLNGVCNSITYDASENAVTIEYIMNPAYIDLESLAKASESQKQQMASFLRNPDSRPMLEMFDKAGAELVLHFTAEGQPDMTINLSPEEIHTIAASVNNRDDYMQQLADIAAYNNANCPLSLEDGSTLNGVTLQERSLCYNITLPDTASLASSELVRDKRISLWRNISSNATDSETAGLLRLLRQLEFSLSYSLTAPSDSSATPILIEFPYAELDSLI